MVPEERKRRRRRRRVQLDLQPCHLLLWVWQREERDVNERRSRRWMEDDRRGEGRRRKMEGGEEGKRGRMEIDHGRHRV